MATWTRFTYGPQPWQQGMYWVPSDDTAPTVNPGRPCLLYCPGHGWEGRAPSYFFGPPAGQAEALFTGQIEPAELTDEVVCVSIWQASANYDLPHPTRPAWAVDHGAYAEGDIVSHSGSAWWCRKAHASASNKEPGAGSLEVWYWLELEANNPDNFLLATATGEQAGPAPGLLPAFGWTNARDFQRAVQYLKRHRNFFGIDPNKIVGMGSSAGGQAVGAAVFGRQAPALAQASPAVSRDHAHDRTSDVQGLVLDITPADFNLGPFGTLLQNLVGRNYSEAEWDALDTVVKEALSPLPLLKATKRAKPCYLAYSGSRKDHIAGSDDPPWIDFDAHHARNGWELLLELEAQGQTNLVFLEDSSVGGFFERWTSSSASTQVPDTDRALDIWNWLKALWGL